VKITRIQSIKGYRIFRDFSWPAEGLLDFASYNVIYGWNGAGKTSLSNLFHHVQTATPLAEGIAKVTIDNATVSSADFKGATLPQVRTFNRDTVNRNVFEVPDQQFPPVFFLGEDSVEKQKRIEELKVQLASGEEEEGRWNRKLARANAALEAFCAEEAKSIKHLLTVAGGGPYNNYNAGDFRQSMRLLAGAIPPPTPLSAEARSRLLEIKDSKPMDKLSHPPISFPDVKSLTARSTAILERSVVSTVISALTKNTDLAAWVSTGLKLHAGPSPSATCQFCDQPLEPQRLRELEAHFNDEFERFQGELTGLITEIQTAQSFGDEFKPPAKEALYGHLRVQYDEAVNSVRSKASTVSVSLGMLICGLEAKKKSPFTPLDLHQYTINVGAPETPASTLVTVFQVLMSGIAAVNAATGVTAFNQLKALIDQHNQHTDSFDKEMSAARRSLAKNEQINALAQWNKMSTEIDEARTKAGEQRTLAGQIRTAIAEMEIQVRQHQRPAEELNKEVASYLGRNELRFEVDKAGYRISRGGQPARHLSDGERTAIAFLYFLKSLEGTDFDLKTGIVVIDDPVSSLDANSLFNAFAFMKQRTADVGQLFVLTHNFAFFRQVRNWFNHMPGQGKKNKPEQQPARFYMLSSSFVDGQRQSKISTLDPFLHQYESEYHYLFKRIYDESSKDAQGSIEAYYVLPNIARRLLESFLAFRLPDRAGELFKKFEGIDFDTAKKTRILRFLHTYSHFDLIAEPDHDVSVLSETPAILKDVIELIRHCDEGHCKSMIEVTSVT
jgi:wobble nucleotide-excising tRNase